MRLPAAAPRWTYATAAGLVLVAIGWWAGRATLVSPISDPDLERSTVIATVTERTVGRSLTLTVTVEQPFQQVAVNGLAGTVTSVDLSDQVRVGDVLYTVDTIPVRAVEGGVPFYRALGPGVAGVDVAQLQRALAALGYYHGAMGGRYDAGTATAVRAWQRKLRMPATGTTALGELVAVPKLPSPLRLGDQIARGARLGGGESAVSAPSGRVAFTLVVSPSQATQIPPDATVAVTHSPRVWPAVVVDNTAGEDGSVRLALAAPGGGPVCADACGSLPAQERLALRGQVTLVPDVTGPTVPVAAVRTRPDGTTYVMLADGAQRDVTVRATAGGLAVVDGLRAGDRVLMFGATPEAAGA